MSAARASTGTPPPGRRQAWILAIRPKTLPVSVVPVLVGSALAWTELDRFSVDIFLVAALVAVMIQVGSNLYNDVADFERGADAPDQRLGPPRAVAQGWLAPADVRKAALGVLLVAFFCGLYLVTKGGLPIFIVGVVSILAALAYSGGPKPIAYTPLGEFFVWLFFGIVAVGGTFYLHSGRELTATALLAGSTVGLPAAAVLVVNNTRDIENDRRAGRRTFPVLFGRHVSNIQYGILVLAAIPCAVWLSGPGVWRWIPLVALPMAALLTQRFVQAETGMDYNRVLVTTARFQFVFGVLICLGLVGNAVGGTL
jgi:1,4-dihydroxy-2-naphthoate octaprenyltransferase